MRRVINISLPQEMSKTLQQVVKDGDYASKSEFFRVLFRMWLEGKIIKDLAQSRKELSQGQGKKLKSLKDLR